MAETPPSNQGAGSKKEAWGKRGSKLRSHVAKLESGSLNSAKGEQRLTEQR